jgi:hypothetical protein
MGEAVTDAQALPTKVLFDRYVRVRVSTRWAAFYLVATSALILAWSRSPEWAFKVPFELFMRGKEPLTISAGFAPIFGPIIELFFFFNFFTIHAECLLFGRLLVARLQNSEAERRLLQPPFVFKRSDFAGSTMFLLFLLVSILLTLWILGDFFLLEFGRGDAVWELLLPIYLSGVAARHRGQDVGTLVYGFWQPWLYLLATVLEIIMLGKVFCDTWAYCRSLVGSESASPCQQAWEWLARRWRFREASEER